VSVRRRRPPALAAVLLTAAIASPAWADDLVGTADDDVLVGTSGPDRIDARAGADRVFAEAGDDSVFGEEGDDSIRGAAGSDTLHGGPGGDALAGGPGRDWLFLAGPDRGRGGRGADVLRAGAGTMRATAGPGADRIDAFGGGRHLLHGGSGDDRISVEGRLGRGSRAYGGPGDDRLHADVDEGTTVAVVRRLAGGDGDDAVSGDAAHLSGGPGSDRLSSFGAPGSTPTAVHCGDGEDHASSFNRADVFDTDCEVVVITLTVTDGEDLVGTGHDDWVLGGSLDEAISTLEGDDQVQDGGGSDTVDLGPGEDFFENWSMHEEGDVDVVTCGDGLDAVLVQRTDVVAADCETVGYRD